MSYGAACEGLRQDVAERLRKIIDHAEACVGDENKDRQLILEDMIKRADRLTDWLDRVSSDDPPVYAYPMEGEPF